MLFNLRGNNLLYIQQITIKMSLMHLCSYFTLKGPKKEKALPKSAFNSPFICTVGVIANQSLTVNSDRHYQACSAHTVFCWGARLCTAVCTYQLTGSAGVNNLLRFCGTQKTPNYINTTIVWNVFYIHFMCIFGSVAIVVLELNNAHADSSHQCDKSIQI